MISGKCEERGHWGLGVTWRVFKKELDLVL